MNNADNKGAVEWHNHWPVVLAALAGTTLSSTYLYSMGVVLPSVEQEFGWSRAQISSGLMIASVAALVLSPFVGMAVDRVGPRRIGLVGAGLFLSAVAAVSTAGPAIWTWWVLWTLLAIAAAFISPTTWAAAVSSLFFRSRGLALAVTLCGTGLGAFLVPNLSNYFLERSDWRGVYLGLAGIWALVALPLLFFCFTSASDQSRANVREGHAAPATASGISAREALNSIRYLKLAGAAAAITLVNTGLTVNLVPILRFQGMALDEAAFIGGLAGIGSIIGRLLGGYLIDRVNGSKLAGLIVLAPIISVLLLIFHPGSLPLSAMTILISGFASGVEFDAIAYLAARYFGMRSFGTLFGTIMGVTLLMAGVGPMLANVAYDVSSSYYPALYAFIPLSLISSMLFLTLGPYEPAEGRA